VHLFPSRVRSSPSSISWGGGMADDYPTEMILGQEGTVIVGIVNHEYRVVNYSFAMTLDGEQLQEPKAIVLAHNMTWEQNVTFKPGTAGTDMKLQLMIFNEENYTVPYRDLHLWINVSGQEPVEDNLL